jgi:predicted signal transduction protein with EAL and GGDEF domain
VKASIGMAFAGPGVAVSDRLIVEADAAMYAAKRGTTSRPVLDLRPAARTRGASGIEQELRQALTTDDLDLAYQPIVRCTDGQVTCVEALLRWPHPVRGAVPAALVVGVAERVGLIDEWAGGCWTGPAATTSPGPGTDRTSTSTWR